MPNGWQRNCAPTGAAGGGLFTQLLDEDDIFAEYIDPLVQEHRDLDAFMVSMDLSNPADQTRFRDEVSALHEHIAKEEDSLFPASVTTLSGDQWDAAIAAWYTAHPGATMLRKPEQERFGRPTTGKRSGRSLYGDARQPNLPPGYARQKRH